MIRDNLLLARERELARELAEVRAALGQLAEPAPPAVSAELDPALLELLLGSVSEFLAVLAPDGRYLYASKASEKLFGWQPEQLLGSAIQDFMHPEDRGRIEAAYAKVRAGADIRLDACRLRCADGHYRWVETRWRSYQPPGESRRILVVAEAAELRPGLALEVPEPGSEPDAEDALTHLPNRRRLLQRLAWLVREGRRGRRFACAMIDLDAFEDINTRYGTALGDRVISGVARVLNDNVRDVDMVARDSGVRFAVVLLDVGLQDAVIAVEKLRHLILHTPLAPEPVTFSAGVAEFTLDVDEGIELLARADAALYVAKGSGRNQVRIYDRKIPAAESRPH